MIFQVNVQHPLVVAIVASCCQWLTVSSPFLAIDVVDMISNNDNCKRSIIDDAMADGPRDARDRRCSTICPKVGS